MRVVSLLGAKRVLLWWDTVQSYAFCTVLYVYEYSYEVRKSVMLQDDTHGPRWCMSFSKSLSNLKAKDI